MVCGFGVGVGKKGWVGLRCGRDVEDRLKSAKCVHLVFYNTFWPCITSFGVFASQWLKVKHNSYPVPLPTFPIISH